MKGEEYMANYVMSDLHGCYDSFLLMLETINLTNDDTLYILGDVIDRGDKSLEIIDYIVSKPNIVWLKGNHEEFLIDSVETKDSQLWFINGGYTTFQQITYKGGETYLNQLYEYIKKLPVIKIVGEYILVHAGIDIPDNTDGLDIEKLIALQDKDTMLWSRKHINNECNFLNYKVVCGHTPVQTIMKSKEDVRIIHRKGYIYIDCGCVYKQANGKLACLRLDDLKEYYV